MTIVKIFQNSNEMEDLEVPHLAMPFKCNLSDCNESMTNTTIINHLCSSHRVDFEKVQFNEKILIMVSTEDSFFGYGKNFCLGVVGVKLKIQQEGSKDVEHFPDPFPILIMASKNNYQRIFNNNADGVINKDADFIALWLTMPKIKDIKLHAILTVYCEEYTTSISKSVNVKDITENRNDLELIHDGCDRLILNSGILNKLSSENSIMLEIILKENLL